MNNMKRIFILLFIALPIISYSQDVVKMKAKFLSINFKDDSGNWQDWSESVECNVLLVLNIDKELITVYLEKEEKYDIVSENVSESENEINFNFVCIDNYGDKYKVILTKDKDTGDTGKITFIGENMAWVYLLIWQ